MFLFEEDRNGRSEEDRNGRSYSQQPTVWATLQCGVEGPDIEVL